MGNAQNSAGSKGELHGKDKKTCQDSSREEERLTACFSKIADSDANSTVDEVSLSILESHLMPHCPQLASQLFSHLTHEKQSLLSRSAYVQYGKQLLQAGQDLHQQQDLLFNLFIPQCEQLNKKDAVLLLQCSHQAAWYLVGFTMDELSEDDPTLLALLSSMFGQEELLSREDLSAWCGRHSPRLIQPIHQYLLLAFLGNTLSQKQDAASPLPDSLADIQTGKYCLSTALLWALSCNLPLTYIPDSASHPTDNPLSSPPIPLVGMVASGGWASLYNTNDQGLSVNRFLHHVMDYKGPTITVLSFQGNMFCIAADQEWRQSGQRWGGFDCRLLQLAPQFRTVIAGEGMLYLNIQDRSVQKGVQVGKDSRTLLLHIDEGLTKVKYYGIDYDIHRLEVWGCADPRIREAQINQKKWEHQEAVKSKDRKLKLEDWKDNPDRQLLNMGGVTTEHAQR